MTRITEDVECIASPGSLNSGALFEVPGDEIAIWNYEIYQACGARHGGDLNDWLRAERALKQSHNPQSG